MRLHSIEPGADVGAGQIRHLAAKSPVLLDLSLEFRRPPGKFPMRAKLTVRRYWNSVQSGALLSALEPRPI